MVTLALAALALQSLPPVLNGAHSHNDYRQKRPFFDAIQRGYPSIEVDICLVDGELLVAHSTKEAKLENTLRSLYLEPLAKWIRDHDGYALRDSKTLQLLVDIKTDAAKSYAALKRQIEPYHWLLKKLDENGNELPPPVLIVISGNRPIEQVRAEKEPMVRIDGRPEDLSAVSDNKLIPLISADWFTTIGWLGVGAMSSQQTTRLADLVKRTHGTGRKLRFWGAPAGEKVWKVLHSAKVDYIGTDDLAALQEFLLRYPMKPTEGGMHLSH